MDTSDRAGAVTDRVPGEVEPTTKLLVKGGGGSYLRSFSRLEIPSPQYLAKARGTSASRS